MSKKTNIKILKFKRVFQVEVAQWTTVIDIDNDLKYLKYVKQRGEGPHRVSKFDEVSYKSEIFFEEAVVFTNEVKDLRMEDE